MAEYLLEVTKIYGISSIFIKEPKRNDEGYQLLENEDCQKLQEHLLDIAEIIGAMKRNDEKKFFEIGLSKSRSLIIVMRTQDNEIAIVISSEDPKTNKMNAIQVSLELWCQIVDSLLQCNKSCNRMHLKPTKEQQEHNTVWLKFYWNM